MVAKRRQRDRNLYSMDPRRRRTRTARRIVLGTLILIVLLASALLIFFMDDVLARFERTYVIHVVLPGATGLAAESPVWLSGHHVGAVTSVGLLPSGRDTLARVVAGVKLPLSVRSQVRTDSEVRLTSIGPISERVIDISAGSRQAPILAPGDTLTQSPQVSPQHLAAQAAVVRADLNAALTDLQAHAPAVRTRMRQMERAFAGLDAVMIEAVRLQDDVDASPGMALLRDPSFAAALEGTRAHAAELPVLFRRMSDSTSAAGEVRSAVARFQLRADSLRTQLDAAATMLNDPNTTLSRMQQDSALLRAVNAARADLDSLIADIRRNPLRYVF
jgi:hypothetical protein